MFRALITPILRSTDCVYSLWYNAPTMLDEAEMRMGEIIARNMLS